jgi:hypothetical protein
MVESRMDLKIELAEGTFLCYSCGQVMEDQGTAHRFAHYEGCIANSGGKPVSVRVGEHRPGGCGEPGPPCEPARGAK